MTNLNYNGVITVQAHKSRGSGLKHVSAPLRTWTFFKLYQTQGYHQLYSEHLKCYGLKFSLYKCAKISDSNQLLLKHPYLLPAPITIIDKQVI